MQVEAAANLVIGRGQRILLRHDDIVERREFKLPERFSGQAAQPVPVDGARRNPTRNRESETRGRSLIESGKHGKEAIGGSVCAAENT
jgi:hypothetical protein